MAYVRVSLPLDAWPEIRVFEGAGRRFGAIDLAPFVVVYTPGFDVASVNYLRALAKHAKAAADQMERQINAAREVSDAAESSDAADSPAMGAVERSA